MDLWTIVRIVVRRWYVAVPTGIVAALVIVGVLKTLPPSYAASASGILVSPSTQVFGSDTLPVNPYLSMSGALQVIGTAVSRVVESNDTREAFAERGLVDEYEIDIDPQSPFLTISVTGGDPDAVLATANEVMDEFSDELVALQRDAGAPRSQLVRLQEVSRPTDVLEFNAGGLRLLVALSLLGLGAAIGLALLVESVMDGRRPPMGAQPWPPDDASLGEQPDLLPDEIDAEAAWRESELRT